MKFEYKKDEDKGDCVAYIDGDGDLIYRTYEHGWVKMIDGTRQMAPPERNGSGVVHKFYKGDKITITF